jgi:hypothetical protein
VIAGAVLVLTTALGERDREPERIERRLAYLPERRELQAAFAYAVDGALARSFELETAFASSLAEQRQRRVVSAARDDNLESALRDLEQILSQLDFDVDLPDASATAAGAAAVDGEGAGGETRSEVIETVVPARFGASPDARTVTLGGATFELAITPLTARAGINTVAADRLPAVLATWGLAPPQAERLAALLLDWRDADDETRIGGADTLRYATAADGYRPPNGPIHDVRSFFFVAEGGTDLVRFMRSRVHLDPEREAVVARYAPLPLLQAVSGVPAERIRAVLEDWGRDEPRGIERILDTDERGRFGRTIRRRPGSEVPVRVRLERHGRALAGIASPATGTVDRIEWFAGATR